MRLRDTATVLITVVLAFIVWNPGRDIVVNLGIVMLYVVFCKTLWGFHFSWERCECCGKKYGLHNLNPIDYAKVLREDLRKECRKSIPKALKPITEGKMRSNVKDPPKANTHPKIPPPPQKRRLFP